MNVACGSSCARIGSQTVKQEPSPTRALDRHRAAVQFGEQLHHRQPQAGAFEFSRQPAVDLAEGHEQPLQSVRRDADAAVGDAQLEKLGELVGGQREAASGAGAGQAAHAGARHAAGAHGHPAAVRRELHRVGQQVIEDLLHLASVRLNRLEVVGGVHVQGDPAGRSFFADDGMAAPQQLRDPDRLQIERHLPGFHLGEVEDVVDQRQQMLAAPENLADEFALPVWHLAEQTVPEHLGESHDGVQRRPQFMRHVGEERRLHAAGLLELDVLPPQRLLERLPLLFDLLARGVVGANQQVSDDRVVGGAQRRDRHHGWKAAAVLADVGELVDVLDPTGRLEHQRFEAGRDRRAEFDAQRPCAGDQFLRIGEVGRRDGVHHLGG